MNPNFFTQMRRLLMNSLVLTKVEIVLLILMMSWICSQIKLFNFVEFSNLCLSKCLLQRRYMYVMLERSMLPIYFTRW